MFGRSNKLDEAWRTINRLESKGDKMTTADKRKVAEAYAVIERLQ